MKPRTQNPVPPPPSARSWDYPASCPFRTHPPAPGVVTPCREERLAGLGVGWTRPGEQSLSVGVRGSCSVSCTHSTPSCLQLKGGHAHLTYLCVGGLEQCVVAIPDDRYRSLRRSMRRTFTKSLGERQVRTDAPSVGGLAERGGPGCSPGGHDATCSSGRHIIGDKGVILHPL